MKTLDLEAFARTPLVRQPFEYLIVPRFVTEAALGPINADYPKTEGRGSFPLGTLTYGPGFKSLVEDLEGEEFRRAFEEKFAVDLTGRPSTITVRGYADHKDGNIHTDSTSKIITILIYFNVGWESDGGRLRLLRNGTDLDDYLAEVPPVNGTLLAFKRSENSWHGHKPFIGPRRVLQFNWVTDKGNQALTMARHQISAPFKKLMSKVRPSRDETPQGENSRGEKSGDENY